MRLQATDLMETDKSISALLLEAGYRHARTPMTTNNGKHQITEASSGRVIGDMDAHEAVTFLKTLAIVKTQAA